MRWRCPNQRRRRCRRRDGAVGSMVRSRMLWLLTCCCQNTRMRRLWQRMSNTSRRRRSARVVAHASEPYSKTETTRARYMLVLVRMLMRCLRKSGFDRRHMAEAALAIRDVMSREEEPPFVIKDPIYVKESTNTTTLLHICNGSWLVGLGVIAIRFVFGQLICIPTRLAYSCKMVRASCSTHAYGAKMAMSSA